MHVRRRPNVNWRLGAIVALSFVACGVACSSNDLSDTAGNGSDRIPDASATCGPGKAGCACSQEGQQVDCGEVTSRSGDYVTCSEGTSTCQNGAWGPCASQYTTFKSVGPVGGDLHTLGLTMPSGDAGACASDPCDPTCQSFAGDNSNGVDASGLQPIPDGGWTLPLGEGGTCQGLQCQVPACAAGQETAITGKVYDPAALNPVYNAVVMIPNGTVQPIPAGVSSDACGGAPLPPAVTYAYSAIDGSFTLTNVPVGTSIPLVIQIGRWRRMVNIDTSSLMCGSPALDVSTNCHGLNNYAGSAGCLTRLPRVQSEGNIPHVAVATGACDAMECMLYRMGVSSSEFTDELNPGRISVFSNGGAVLASPYVNHDASYLLGFACPYGNCPGQPTASTSGITNPGFDTGNFTGWSRSGSYTNVSGWWSTTGNYSARLGTGQWQGSCVYSGTNSVTQAGLVAPAGVQALAVDELELCYGSGNYTRVSLTDTTSGGTQTCQDCQYWAQTGCSLPVTPGHTYTLTLTNNDQNGSGYCTESYFDNVRWTSTPTVSSLLDNYDLVMLPCDCGSEYDSGNWGYSYDDAGRTNLVNYAAQGGRVFSSHWGREWLERTSSALPNGPFPGVANWIGDQNGGTDTGNINTSTTYGQNFDKWLIAIGATTGTSITINPARYDTSSVTAASRLFVSYQSNGEPADFTFDTPVGAAMPVGRVMFTDMHLANGNPYGTFPSNCPAQGSALLQQEDAAEYLLFDLGGCVSGSPLTPPTYSPATFTRDFQGTCPSGYRVVWHYFYWEDSTPNDSNIAFTGWTADTQAQLGTQYPAAPLATASGPNSCPGGPSCASQWVGVDVDPKLAANGTGTWGNPAYASHSWLRVNMTLNPSSNKLVAPTLIAWQQTYDCVSSE